MKQPYSPPAATIVSAAARSISPNQFQPRAIFQPGADDPNADRQSSSLRPSGMADDGRPGNVLTEN
jgi:hypothetical protein